ncbi:MFS transporter [Actinomadura spongiicola]|uniref:MFS transporter n=1 Tax=Actinomadura spongiicola TaxID=2303421 RepID=A0A372GGB4_9ACTN|nr:MFS transporter [Actinomadura spongiicola]RFS84113.1 MFS transporter [Actinomadura spongiicola]
MASARRRWIGLAVLTLPTLLISIDMTVLHLAIPQLGADLEPTANQLLWILDIYGFMIAGFLVSMGVLGDRIGRRKVLLVGAGAFGVASLAAAYSTSAEMLIASRALLGVAGATLMPSTMSLIRNMFPDDAERTKALAVWMGGFMVGSAIGPLVGGLLLEFFWWGSVFLLGVPVMVILLVAGPFLLPEYRAPKAGRLDLLSSVLSLGTVLSLIYGVKRIATHGVDGTVALAIVLGLALGIVFVRRQQRSTDPMIDLRLFRYRNFSISLASLMVGLVAMGGVLLFVNQFLQLVRGLSPLEAGLWMLPQAVSVLVSMQFAPRITGRYRPAVVLAGSMGVVAVGVLLISVGTLAWVVIGMTVMGLGFGPWMLLALDRIITTAPPERAGAASAISETGQEFGLAAGLALLGSLGTAIYRGRLDSLPDGLPPAAENAARESLAGAVETAEGLPGPVGPAMLDAARDAFTTGLQVTTLVSAAIVAAGAVVIGLLTRHEQAPTQESVGTTEIVQETSDALS